MYKHCNPIRSTIACCLVVSAANFFSPSLSNAQQAVAKVPEKFAALAKSLSGATLVVHFDMSGTEKDTDLKQERYELTNVRHVKDDQWLFMARIQYGEHDMTLPLTLPVHWAGDTPIISIDKMPIPSLGTYTARVMIYSDHYAGFWSGGDHGGHLFGIVERVQVPKDAAP